ncbi:MAG TPA: acyl-CoA dehydrogenase family protein [Polyangiales bacterium]|nr:acyl-CoA dehydrogenase family protein [Polyangiales bacterium]
MYLEVPNSLKLIVNQAHQVAKHVFRPISRKYDRAEHEYPKELDLLAALMDGLSAGGGQRGAGVDAVQREEGGGDGVRNGANMATCLGLTELCWGDVGLALSIPRQGLGNAAITAVANPEQKKRFNGTWAAMAITEPGAGSDSANIRTTARLDGDEWVLNGEKIYVTAGSRADSVVVWATLDRNLGRAAIKSFIVPHGTPGMEVVRLDKKMGIRASDTASITLTDCRIPKENLLGTAEIDTKAGFGGVMQTFDNTRPIVAGMAVGVARAALEHTRDLLSEQGIEVRYRGPLFTKSAAEAELIRMEAEWEAGRLLMLKAAWMADNGIPNSMEASMSKAKAARVANRITLRCVELCGALGYSEQELLEKWARDSKILDIFEGTQQIQLLIIARRLLGKRSSELR